MTYLRISRMCKLCALNILALTLLSFAQSADVSVKFSSSDYGSVNETLDSYVVLTVEKDGAASSSFSVIIELDDDSGNEDFISTSWTVFFHGGVDSSDSQTASVFVADDDLPEDDETFTFRLKVATSSVSITSPSTATVTIPANDDANGIISVQSDTPVMATETREGENAINLKIKRERGTFGNVAVSYVVEAMDGQGNLDSSEVEDLHPVTGKVVIKDGKDEAEFQIFVKDDEIPENDERFLLTLTSSDRGQIQETNQSIEIIIERNDSPLRFLHQSVSALEEEEGNVIEIYVVRGIDDDGVNRIGPDTGEVLVDYVVSGNTATANVDYNVKERGTVRFNDGMHNATIEVFIMADDEPEVAENFTIKLLPRTVIGDAIVAHPDTCVVTIETNDKADGVLSIDFSIADSMPENSEEKVFIVSEDDPQSFEGIRILRHGGSFKPVSIDWSLNAVSDDTVGRLTPMSGTITFETNEVEKWVKLTVSNDEVPQEAEEFVFSLLPETIAGKSELDGPTQAKVFIADSDDAYGTISIQRGSKIEVDNNGNERNILLKIAREGGTIGELGVTYSVYYLPPGATNVKDAMPGIVTQPSGNILLEAGLALKDVRLGIEESAFLQTDAAFEIKLESVDLSDRTPVIISHTPLLGEHSTTLLTVHEEYANSEVGFVNASDLHVHEPDDGPMQVTIEISREGLSSETVVQISYRNDVVNSKEVTKDVDYIPGVEQVVLQPGHRNAELVITILPDDEPETDEILVIRMDRVNPDNQKLKKEASEKRIVILENDSPGGIFQFEDGTLEHFQIEEEESETIAVTVIRTEGDLATRMVEYDVHPNAADQFYGVPEIIIFQPGQRSHEISLVPKDDHIPELEQEFTLELLTYGTPQSVLGEFTSIKINVSASDDPHGVFVFAERNDENGIPGRQQIILESTDTQNFSCFYVVRREMGVFGEVTVGWKMIPDDTNDVHPVHGILAFGENDTEAIITFVSLNDKLPETMEEFSILLHNTTGGARIGSPRNASLMIEANDKAIGFDGPSTVSIKEGEDLVMDVTRQGSGSDVTTVMYKTRMRSDADGDWENLMRAIPEDDYVSVLDGIVHFSVTSMDETVTISILNDDIPEDDEEFFVELYNATGDYVVYDNTVVQVKIVQNDNSSGVFSLSSPRIVSLEEGLPYEFRNVEVFWSIVPSADIASGSNLWEAAAKSADVSDFERSYGIVEFQEEENEKAFSVLAIKDEIPEYEENFVLLLVNVSGGSAQLSSDTFLLIANVSIAKNDHPHGRMDVGVSSRHVQVAEDASDRDEVSDDVEELDVPATHLNITIDRSMGTDGNIQVVWEMYDSAYSDNPFPACSDLLLGATTHGQAFISLQQRRPNTGTSVYSLSKGAYIVVAPSQHPSSENLRDGYAISLWMKPDLNELFRQLASDDASDMLEVRIPLISKYNQSDDGTSYMLGMTLLGTSEEDIHGMEVTLIYRTTDTPDIEKLAVVALDEPHQIFASPEEWTNFVINIKTDEIQVHVDAQPRGKSHVTEASYYDINESILLVGASRETDLEITYIGLMQDIRIYSKPLSDEEIKQFYNLPAQSDLTPVSGELEYREGESEKTVTIYSVNDDITEFNEEFTLRILDATNGAVPSTVNNTSDITGSTPITWSIFELITSLGPMIDGLVFLNSNFVLTVLKSDNSNGLFGFYQTCNPREIDEGGKVECFINRTRGSEGSVTLHWSVHSDGIIETNDDDFDQNHGSVEFNPGQTEASFVLNIIDDDKPEISEEHKVVLESAVSHDGVTSTASYSGASIDEEFSNTYIGIKKGDKPHGVLQFSNGEVPDESQGGKIPIGHEPLVVNVQEEQHKVTLMVVRAAGWHGDVTVEWRTRDGTAVSNQTPKDFEAAAGTLDFRDGEGYKLIDIILVNDDDPELEKSFFVDLRTPTGGAEVNAASEAEVVIAPSDNAYGVYQFTPDSLAVTVTEPETGSNVTQLRVSRSGGHLGHTVLVWQVRSDPDGDLGEQEGKVSFEFGQESAEIEISVLADDVPEFDEHFTIELLEVTHGVLGGTGSLVAIVTVPANDDPHGVVMFVPGTVTVNEDDKNATLTVKRIAGRAGTIRVHYKTMDQGAENGTVPGTAMVDGDFLVQRSSVLMAENVTTANFNIPIIDDDIPETDEAFYVELYNVELLPSEAAFNSPRLGNDQDIQLRVVISENDSPHGVLELDASAVTVDEEWSDKNRAVVNIVRKFGTFGDITVGVSATPGDAQLDEDYSLSSTEVDFLDGESIKPFPIHIINDFTPELEEYFSLQLLRESVTGGAQVGDDTDCRVTIKKSDHPYGSLEISVIQSVVSEPQPGEPGIPVKLTVKRMGGLLGVVSVRWKAEILGTSDDAAPGSADSMEESGSGTSGDASGEAITDIDISSGILYFVSDEDTQEFTIKIMPDDIPENDEFVVVKLDQILPESNGVINREKDNATIRVPANDHPYGIVSLDTRKYNATEEDGASSDVVIRVLRSAGTFGTLRVVYSTEEVDLISEVLENGQDIVKSYFEEPTKPSPEVVSKKRQNVDLTSVSDHLTTCAEVCMRQRTCEGFLYSSAAFECIWIANADTNDGSEYGGDREDNEHLATNFMHYKKNAILADMLYDTQAKSGMDFMPITGASVLLHEGHTSADLIVKILDDETPELDERFKVKILDVSVLNIEISEGNAPLIGDIRFTDVIIAENDNPYGVFTLHSTAMGSKDDGKLIEAEERPQLSLEMVVERKGGSVGEVTVDWIVLSGTALRGVDYVGDDVTLKFSHGETRKVVSLSVMDDDIPELDEDVDVLLDSPTGGAIVSSTEAKVHVIIMANDRVGGVVSFDPQSRAVIGDEGDEVRLDLIRTEPAEGSCVVTWTVTALTYGHRPSEGVNATDGEVHFKPKQMAASFWLRLLADNNPEIKEEYRITLTHVTSSGIPQTGSAALDPQGSIAGISIRGSDEPHGLFRFAETSQVADAEETMGNLELYVTRTFGSVGEVKVFFDIIPGTLGTLNPDIEVATPGLDFTIRSYGYEDGRPYIFFPDGVTSVSITFSMIDDDTPELNEIFHVNLTEAILVERFEGALNFIPPSIDSENCLAQVVIDANDGTKGVISFHQDSLNVTTEEVEDGNATVTLTILRERGTYGEVTFFTFPQNGEAEVNKDYWCEAMTIKVTDSQDKVFFNITILDDALPEGTESFEVLLGNPSTGLELGNFTRSTVHILPNDDAHGRLSFSNQPVIYLDEPENDSIANSRAELVIVRNPRDGTFGQISVKYKIEKVSIDDDEDGGKVTDLYPVEGYVVINDGVQQEVLEISAVADDEAEIAEEFVVTLYEPQGGATLDMEKTSTRIVIHENDAPYGKFKIYPKGSSTNYGMLETEEGPGVKTLQFDVVREQGTRGTVYVVVQTQRGTASPHVQSPDVEPLLSALQVFDASQMQSFHAFSVGPEQYLLALSADRSGPLSSEIGSDGTLATLTHGVHSTLYRYQGLFVPVQTVETDGASAATSFTTDTSTYIFIANHGKYGRHETVSRLYSVGAEGELTVVNDVQTMGASAVCHFAADDTNFLVVANSMDNNQISSIDSYVYRFDEDQQKLTLVQTLPTRGAADVKCFYWDGDVYLAIANSQDTELRDDSVVPSVIYKRAVNDDGVYSFMHRTNVEVSHAAAVEVTVLDGMLNVIFSSASIDGDEAISQVPDHVDIFKVVHGAAQHELVLHKHQSLNVSGSTALIYSSVPSDLIKMKNVEQRNGHVHLLAVASPVKSGLFQLNPDSGNFEQFLTAGPSAFLIPFTTKSSHENTTVFAAAIHSGVGEGPKATFLNTMVKSGVYSIGLQSGGLGTEGDYLPTMNNLVLEYRPGQTKQSLAVSVLDDDIPEDAKEFTLLLDGSMDGRIQIDGDDGHIYIRILSNDDAHGVLGFAEDSQMKLVEETDDGNTFTLNVLRAKASFGAVTSKWVAEGSLADILPLEGTVIFEDGQSKAGIQITVIDDDIPEVEETVRIVLTEVVEGGDERPDLGARIDAATSVATIRILPNDSPHGIVRWSATSLRTVISEPETLSGASQLVTLELIREQGKLGDIQVSYKTALASNLPAKSQAMPGADYIARDDIINMRENVTKSTMAISIIPDDIAEDIESFYVVLTDVEIIGESPFGSKPGLGPPGTETAEITIDENDHARGFIQFNVTRNLQGAAEAFELPGLNNSFKLPLVRLVGTFRSVGVDWLARPMTAKGSDFYPQMGSVHFEEGQKNAEIEIFIVDDQDVEFMESFTVQLIGTTGGAKLGGDLTVTANILPNDSPSGMFGFLETAKSVQESSTADDPFGKVEFEVQRYQGSSDDVILSWSLDADAHADLTPTLGKLHFASGDRVKTIIIRSLPDQILEGNEEFNLRLLSATGGAEISPVAGTAKITVLANEGAAGTVSVDSGSLDVLMAEPDVSYEGTHSILLRRGPGHFGHCYVRWQITPADANTFVRTEGEAEFEDLQNETEIVVSTVPDDVPEIGHAFTLRLISATGGAEIDPSSNSVSITVAASDSPHGTFTFSQPVYHVKESGGNVTPGGEPASQPSSTEMPSRTTTHSHLPSIASLTLLRNDGHLGEVSVTVKTISGTALENEDFYGFIQKLVFADGDSFRVVDVELLNDVVPEGPEEFYVNITEVVLLSYTGNDYVPKGPNNITLDIAPTIGEVPSATVRITKSDGAEGVLEFPPEMENVKVEESNGTVEIPIARLGGTYGTVSVTLTTMDKTAERGMDYLAPSAGISVVFEDGQTLVHAPITLVDDAEMEMEETFNVVLSGVTGGAKLGQHLVAEVIIRKSEYPNGLLHFMGETELRIRNPPMGGEGTKMSFVVERKGGNQGEINARWRVFRSGPYYGETFSSTPLDADIVPPLSGSFQFKDGEGGQREILLTMLPSEQEQEVEEYFTIVLEDTDPAEVSSEAGNVSITVMRKGDPNGILKFAELEDESVTKVVQEPQTGSVQVVFPIVRSEGTLGELVLKWVVEPQDGSADSDIDVDLRSKEGEVVFRDGQPESEVVLYVEADDIPELAEYYVVKLVEVEGGAGIDRDHDKREFSIEANDDPHGVISIHSADQRIAVLSDMTRVVVVNVTRQRGTFGMVAPRGDASYLDHDTADVYIPNGSPWETVQVTISPSAFLAVGDKFTIELTNVEYMDDDGTIPPRLYQHVKASVPVPPEAGNPQVGFDPVVSRVYNVTRNACRMRLTRIGLYGDVDIQWSSGYPANDLPTNNQDGQTMPTSDTVTMTDRQAQMNVSMTLFPNFVDMESFAAHITRVSSAVSGGAGLLPNRHYTEIEPCGVVRFAKFSQDVAVTEDSGEVTLTIQRLYGSRYSIDVLYSTSPVSAIPGKDFVTVTNGRVRIDSGEQEARIKLQLVRDDIPEMSKVFLVRIIEASEPHGIYKGLSPRVLSEQATSKVTIKESDNAHGVMKFGSTEITVGEQSSDGSNIVVVMLTIHRTVGAFGKVSVMVSTIGAGESWKQKLKRGIQATAEDSVEMEEMDEFMKSQTDRMATAGSDYEVRQINASFEEGQTEAQIPIVILDDTEPEPTESFFVYLHSTTGGASVGAIEKGKVGGIMKIFISSNDYPNGNIGFASENGVKIYEDTKTRSLDLVVTRQYAYGNVVIKWRAVTEYGRDEDSSGYSPYSGEGFGKLKEQLQQTQGEVMCKENVLQCVITVILKDDKIAEFETWFLVELYDVSDGAKIDSSRRFVNVTMAESDHPYGLFQFSLKSRLPVVSKGNEAVGLTVERVGGQTAESKVHYKTEQLKRVSKIAGATLYPAVADIDYVETEGSTVFKPGQKESFVNIPLHPRISSANPLPQIFQVKLSYVSGAGAVDYNYDTANVTIVGNESTKRVWRVYEALQQNLDDGVIQSILAQLQSLADEPMDAEQVVIFHGALSNIVKHARQRKLPNYLLDAIHDLLCKLLNPYRSDSVVGFTEFGETAEQFAYALMTDVECRPDESSIVTYSKCRHMLLQIPVDLLNAQQYGVDSLNPTCYDIAFIEYSSQLWYSVHGEKGAMSNKLFSVSIDGQKMPSIVTPVRYRIHTSDARISPKGAECVLWNDASSRWMNKPDVCEVEHDTYNYVDCACHHMSVYAVRGPTDDLAGYNEATYVACFICAIAAALTVLGHHVCAKHTTFASRLMMHMCFACGASQLFFVVSTLTSEEANKESCAAIGIFLHYFWIAQFTWILVQAINIWKVLVMSNENSSQFFTIFFIIGWGAPAVIVVLHGIIMYALGFRTIPEMYGDVHENGDMCFILNPKAGLLSAVAPAGLCIMVACTIGLQLYQRDHSWKQFDDIFRGRFNESEIPLLFWFFFLLSISWIWGGLHLAFGQMWMLVLFILFEMLQGLYLLLVYGIFHNQLVRPVKSGYEVGEGQNGAKAYATSAAGSQTPSVSGDVMNRSTQNLVGKGREEFDWVEEDRNFVRNPISRSNANDSYVHDDSADFDDLMFALKADSNLSRERIIPTQSSPIKPSPPRTSQHSLDVIDDVTDDDEIRSNCTSPRHGFNPASYPIADTHL